MSRDLRLMSAVTALLLLASLGRSAAAAPPSLTAAALQRLVGPTPGKGTVTKTPDGVLLSLRDGSRIVEFSTLLSPSKARSCAQAPKPKDARWWLLDGDEPLALRFGPKALTAWRFDEARLCLTSQGLLPSSRPAGPPLLALSIKRDCGSEDESFDPVRRETADLFSMPGEEDLSLTLKEVRIDAADGKAILVHQIPGAEDDRLCLEPRVLLWRLASDEFLVRIEEPRSDYVGADSELDEYQHHVFRCSRAGSCEQIEHAERSELSIGKWNASGDERERRAWLETGGGRLEHHNVDVFVSRYDGDEGSCRTGTDTWKKVLQWRLTPTSADPVDLHRVEPVDRESPTQEGCDAKELRRRARAAMKEDSFAEAQVLYRLAVELKRGDGQLLADQGWAAFRAGDLATALSVSEEALRRAKAKKLRGAILYNLGRVAEAEGRTADARSLYEQSLQARPHEGVRKRLGGLGGSMVE